MLVISTHKLVKKGTAPPVSFSLSHPSLCGVQFITGFQRENLTDLKVRLDGWLGLNGAASAQIADVPECYQFDDDAETPRERSSFLQVRWQLSNGPVSGRLLGQFTPKVFKYHSEFTIVAKYFHVLCGAELNNWHELPLRMWFIYSVSSDLSALIYL